LVKLVKKNKPNEWVNTGIAFRRLQLEKLDAKRGDIPRTRYIRRLLEQDLKCNENENVVNQNISSSTPSASVEVGRHTERQASAMLVSSHVRVFDNTDNVKVQGVPTVKCCLE
jgi:arylamine N-acetyltransferase